jgi:hypothetical protein
MAYYGNLFRTPGAQGVAVSLDGGDAPEVAEVADDVARAWLQSAAERGSPRDRAAASGVLLRESRELSGAQGPRAAVRPLMNGLASVPWFAPFGLQVAGRFVARTLNQVTLYLTDEVTRTDAKTRVVDLIDDETRLVIGHSLGSVIAYEAMFETQQPLSLITLGSPLGLRGAIYDRLRPQPPVTPPNLLSWTNVADVDDLVAAAVALRTLFPADSRKGPIPFADHLSDNGAQPHEATHYLGKKSVGLATREALDRSP